MKFTTFDIEEKKLESGEFYQIGNETLWDKLVEIMFILYEAEPDKYTLCSAEDVWNYAHIVLFTAKNAHYVVELEKDEITITTLDN